MTDAERPGLPVIVRADAGPDIGAGHLMRMLALARALASRTDVTFATACDRPALLEQVRRSGIRLVTVPARHPDARDAEAIVKLKCGPEAPTWAIVDGYHFDAAYLARLGAAGFRVMAVDDEPRLQRYDVDILLDHNPGALRKPYVTSGRTLLGPRFLLMRPEVIAAAATRHQTRGRPIQLAVTMGDADVNGLTPVVIRSLRTIEDVEITAVVGASNPLAAAVIEEFGPDPSVRVLVHPPNLPALLAASDLLVTAVGITLWEAACIGVPTLAVSGTRLQRDVAASAAEYGAHRWIGDAAEISPARIREAVVQLLADQRRAAEMCRLGHLLVDGHGAQRVADALLATGSEWIVRRADLSDAEPIWEIAADESVRRVSFSTGNFTFPPHERWYRDKLASTTSRFWVVERDGTIGGFVRYDTAPSGGAELSIAVAAALRGRGLGLQLLEQTADAAAAELGVDSVRAVVISDNTASQRAFARAGFTVAGVEVIQGRRCVVFARSPRPEGVRA